MFLTKEAEADLGERGWIGAKLLKEIKTIIYYCKY